MGFIKALIAIIVSITVVNFIYSSDFISYNYPIIKKTFITPEKKCYFMIMVMAIFIMFF
jgi:hypothetical protein